MGIMEAMGMPMFIPGPIGIIPGIPAGIVMLDRVIGIWAAGFIGDILVR